MNSIRVSDREKADLTYRELEVLKLIVQGMRNLEIAEELNISINTVKAHCKSIFEKLDVDNRVDATVKAISTGIIWL